LFQSKLLREMQYNKYVILPGKIEAPWSESPQEIISKLDSSDKGLSSQEAEKRLKELGPNEIKESKRTFLEILLSQYKNPLILILIAASFLSGILGDKFDAVIILAMVFVNSIMGFIQEYRSEKAVSTLKKKISRRALVIRSGQEIEIDAANLVTGDLVKLRPGSVVPADLRILEINNLSIDESIITGESFPVEKTAQRIEIEKPIPQELKNTAFMGTNVEAGTGIGIVYATAQATEVGKTTKYFKKSEPETEFQRGTRRFGNFLVVIILSLVAFIFVINITLKPLIFSIEPNLLEALLFSLALAIGITPELLPIIITINLSRGAVAMSKKGAIVKKLMSIEDLGNSDVLCTDKTGTLTQGEVFLKDYFRFDGQKDEKVLDFAIFSSSQTQEEAKTFPLEMAIEKYAKVSRNSNKSLRNFEKIDEISFDFQRRRNSVLVRKDNQSLILSKGSTETILKNCKRISLGSKVEEISDYQNDLKKKYINLSKEGFRTLALAYKEVENLKKISPKDDTNLTFLGFLTFSDEPKKEVKETLEHLERLGIQIKILTGDNEYVAAYICREVGLQTKDIITGNTLDSLDDQKLAKLVDKTTVFAKIVPEHKVRIIKALKDLGRTVAFLGDGANDAPALKMADVGISVDSAVDVAKEAADIVLLRKSLDVLIEAVMVGRKTFGNTMKYIFAISSSNFGNMFSLAGASLFLPFLPLLPSQVILTNFAGDMPSLAISTDNVDRDYLKKPKHWDIKAIGTFMIPFGLLSSIFDFATFFLMLYVIRLLNAPIEMFRTGWFIESVATEILVIYSIRTRRFFLKSRPSSLLLILGLGTIAAITLLTYSPLSFLFKFKPIPIWVLLIIIVFLAAYFTLAEVAKRIYYKKVTA